MRKYLLLVLTVIAFSSFIHAEEENINECMSDIYFANGINTTKKDAQKQLDFIIKPQVLKDQFSFDETKMNQTVDYKLAYNNTMGIAFDLLEAYGQKQAEHGTFWWTLGTVYDVFGGIAKQGLKEITSEGLEAIIVETLKSTASQFIIDPIIEEAGLKDLAALMKDLRSGVSPSNVWQTLNDSAAALENYDATRQLSSYKSSIKLGHSTIVIAHSQGNLFANVVYNKIATDSNDKWMTEYFYMIGIASPAGVGTGPEDIEIVTFDNDPITNIPDSIGIPILNPMRYIIWDSDDNSRTSPCLNGFYPNNTVVSPCELGIDSGHPWYALDNDKIDFHLFTYYMSTEVSKTKIMKFVDTSLKAHSEAKSQWLQDEEFDTNTCSHKITVKHRHDPNNIIMDEMVYPFAPNKKLYWVNGEWVKASCGGTEISSEWLFKKSNECHLLVDTNETITTPLLGNAELNATIILANIHPDKKVYLALVRTDFPHNELIDTIEVDTNQSTFWHLFEGLEYGRYNTNIYSSDNEVYDLAGIYLNETTPKGTLIHSVDMQYYTRVMTFDMPLADETFIITNLGTLEDFTVHFGTDNLIANDGSDSGFMDGNTWRVNTDGDLETVWYFMGIPISIVTHKITGTEGSCYILDSTQVGSNWHERYRLCP